ncbi:hypothetical protein ELH42_29860 (plasmid) [Rhizobium ruizarguesonis]|uniref:hypothetical protein n=1 Tax=Rhizobium ruizarguesonis TaxID=2081791 RepID=UPI0010311BD8|nr:hypothetical protein [Rhizobium ruizarguesonis]TBB60045.1 hypothetical protein ELH42_29860 [Rhizobium ruizarguesonis]
MKRAILAVVAVLVVVGWFFEFRIVQIMPAADSGGNRIVAGFGLKGYWLYDDVWSRCAARKKDQFDTGYDPNDCEATLTGQIDKLPFVKTIQTSDPKVTF